MEHSLHVASKHFVEAVAPASPTSICKKVKAALVKARNNGELNLDEFDEALSSIDLENVGDQNDGDGDEDDDGNDDDDSDFTPGDSLGKALALVKQVQYPLCIVMPTNPVSRFGCPPRREHFSNHHALKLGSNPSSFFSGSAPDGHHFISFLIGCCLYERYRDIQITPAI